MTTRTDGGSLADGGSLGKRYQFQIDGRSFGSPVRSEWELAAKDAVAAGYAVFVGPGRVKLDGQADIAVIE